MLLPVAAQKAPQINAAISQVVKEMYPDVQHIRYEFAQDWTGQWAVFFRVLLSDEASKRENLREIAPRVVWSMSEKLYVPDLGLFPHFYFRSESEQKQVNEPAWA